MNSGTTDPEMTHTLTEALAEARRLEKGQTRFYRSLAAEAELANRPEEAERLNELHADEQHHLSRLTARLLELEEKPAELPGGLLEVSLDGWQEEAREREAREVETYETLLARDDLDDHTRAIVEEILASERQHHRHLGGKWMPA